MRYRNLAVFIIATSDAQPKGDSREQGAVLNVSGTATPPTADQHYKSNSGKAGKVIFGFESTTAFVAANIYQPGVELGSCVRQPLLRKSRFAIGTVRFPSASRLEPRFPPVLTDPSWADLIFCSHRLFPRIIAPLLRPSAHAKCDAEMFGN